MRVDLCLDTIFIPFSLFITVTYHVYLCHTIKNNPSRTTYGIDKLKRTTWSLNLNQGDSGKAMLTVQSLRNTLMSTILTASITILINLGLAALSNNTYNASHLFSSGFFGSKSDEIFVLKYGSTSLCLVMSFLFSSMAIGFLIDANFLMNAYGEFLSGGYTETILERGFTLALVGSRVLCVAVPLMLWMLGPVPVLVASLLLVFVLHELDFVCKFPHKHNKCIVAK
ncbi:hypothetical protein PHAVU_008G082000 [Phaseolus vulgaris]|uniref:PGG domain-containing protein n=1 Tax=Phaseolus vulgaris TaxID=3885 RepID=V7B2K8_PHAVU|nr:hypothetical protein PHAVU_008G082000g [Phaseolus vulgaris]ESW12069.1 hypothetical protein PHAVU_008G082000g [Phaseolus vulgaris]